MGVREVVRFHGITAVPTKPLPPGRTSTCLKKPATERLRRFVVLCLGGFACVVEVEQSEELSE
jgi:hypothetical protein